MEQKSMIMQRLSEYIADNGIPVSVVEKKAGISNATLVTAFNRGGAIGVDKLEKILNAFPDISPTWLMKGTGEIKQPLSITQGDITTQVVGNSNTIGVSQSIVEAVLGEVAAQRRVVEKSQEHISSLLTLIKR